MIIILTIGAPSLLEINDYYATKVLKISNRTYLFRYIIMAFGSFLVSFLIKKWIFDPFKRSSFYFFNLLYLCTSFISYSIIMMDFLSYDVKFGLLLLWDFFVLFSYFGVFICTLTILLSYCPKSIEAIFSSIFFTIEIFCYIFSLFVTYILMKIFDADIYKKKKNLNFIFGLNFLMILSSFCFIYKILIP